MKKALFLLLAGAACAALAAEVDALAISANIVARHMPHGPVMDPVFTTPDSDEIRSYSRCGDAGVWTGHFLAAESFRYAVTKSPDALANIKSAMQGIRQLLDVTGNNLLARCAFPENSPYANDIIGEEGTNHPIYTGFVDGAKWYWAGDTSRDQITGAMFGLTAAWNLVNDPEVRAADAWLASRIINYLLGHGWVTFNPDGAPVTTFWGRADEQLMVLKLGTRQSSHYSTQYRILSLTTSPEAIVAVGVDATDPYGSYYKFNLDAVTMWSALTSGDNSFITSSFNTAYKIFRAVTVDHQNVFFDLVDRAVKGPDAERDQRIRDGLDQWLLRPRRNVWVDNTLSVPTCGDGTRACDPIPVPQRVTTDFIWQRNPFQLAGGGDGTIETAGIDYILPYWMARYYGVVSE
jgi:hypothetical protein